MEDMLFIILVVFLSLLFGGLIGWLIAKRTYGKREADLRINASEYVSKALFENVSNQVLSISEEKKELNKTHQDLLVSYSASQESLKYLKERLEGQKEEMDVLQKKLHADFELLANRLLEEKSVKFAKQNKDQISEILNPLQEKISGFEKKVQEVYFNEAKERSSLQGEIKSLVDLNRKISNEAQNLASALKGDNKQQGNWGEIVLERVLERSGLVKDQEYGLQFSDKNDSGKRIQPDVIVHLPDKKHLIIDSKVSLVAYEKFVNERDLKKQNDFLKQHIISLKSHIKGLSQKNYASAEQLVTPDFVLMFLPIESSFSAAIQGDSDLFNFAWELKIVIVSPSTLLATLKTVASIWKQEKQTKNALEIARQAGALYDKFVGFVEDMQKIRNGIDQVDRNFSYAMNKLQNGKGNLIGRAEKMKELGVKASKSLPEQLKR